MTVQEINRWMEGSVVEDKGPFPPAAAIGDLVLRVRHAPHWQVLRSPHRMRIFEAIRSSSGCSIKDLAEALCSSTTALYYHLDLLTRAGLITSTVVEPDNGAANRGGRRPAVFVARGERITIEYDPANGRDRRRVAAMSRTWLEESQNELLPQAHTGDVPESLNAPAVVSTTTWEILTDTEAQEIRSYLSRVEGVLAQARARRDREPSNVRRANHHVAFMLTPTREQVLPSPMLTTRAVAVLEPVLPGT